MKLIVIKCGGSILDQLSADFFQSLLQLQQVGYRFVFVHGGGPDINEMLETVGVTPEFNRGLRKTTAETLNIVEMVLAGKTNRKLVMKLNEYGFKAIGLNGSDECLVGELLNEQELGFVGEITDVNTKLLNLLLHNGYTPVMTPIGMTKDGIKLNINADYAASAVAKALQAEQFLFVTDVEGVMIRGKLVETISEDEINAYIENGEISGGMIPKVHSALAAFKMGLDNVRIISGKKAVYDHEQWNGTKIVEKVVTK